MIVITKAPAGIIGQVYSNHPIINRSGQKRYVSLSCTGTWENTEEKAIQGTHKAIKKKVKKIERKIESMKVAMMELTAIKNNLLDDHSLIVEEHEIDGVLY